MNPSKINRYNPHQTNPAHYGSNHDTSENIMNPQIENTVKIGLALSQQVLGQTHISDYFSLQFLKPYFNVNNSYVLKKIKHILFPFLYRPSSNIEDHSLNDVDTLDINRNRIEYADLYIPLMSFITYILLIAFNSATTKQSDFNPDILGIKASKNFCIVLFHCFVLKIVFYVFCNVSVQVLEMISYVTYKFVLMVLNVLLWILTKNITVYYVFLVYTIFISMIFMHHILNYRIKQVSEVQAHQKLIIYMVSCLEILSVLIILWDLK